MQNAGFILRAYSSIDNGEVQKSFMNTQIKLFCLLSEDTSAVSKEDMVAFFGSLCDNFINQLPICVDNNIVTDNIRYDTICISIHIYIIWWLHSLQVFFGWG